jgi:hypothetical protein
MIRNGVQSRIALCAILLLSALQDAPTLPMIGSGHLPRDLSPWSMFLKADIVAQAVIVGLAFASAVTWTVWLAKTLERLLARRRLGVILAMIPLLNRLCGGKGKLCAP